MRPHQATTVIRRARLLAPLIALPLAAGCAGQADALGGIGTPDGMPGMNAATAPQATVMNVEQLAKAIGCGKPTIQTRASDITAGYCDVKKQRYFLNTFPTKEGLDAWATEEQGWGSVLVGDQWAVGVAPESLLPALQRKLGGLIKGEHAMAGDGSMRSADSGMSTDTSTGTTESGPDAGGY
jgi:hypothetical protein